ncbi:hypothetical protein ACMU_03155 [Actibacterium mucosum KCTC 23349]|uniref:Pyruvate/2-oxoglutarate dehydrogenase complex, dihydrolipoamide acyltransferase (E2) component n=1 Tax=Actibacterium mucosum KCTC 23349 TaxID=1454373 RepID=A0A037ZN61_9RHOB|nr:DUF3035 domain-containing protein [Actibacterium mucosum]KAJ57519.1 hypothetical protein ACMU_03155 [Actibacterium mucosum KCTC 23349]
MRRAQIPVLIALVAAMAVAGCGRKEKQPSLLNIRSPDGTPDEFTVLPTKPIEVPEDLAALPEPTPGGANRVDPTPEADAVLALGGNVSRITTAGVPRTDGALVSQASRFGVSTNIRETLAAEDLEYRRQNDGRLLERLLNVNVYFVAYEPQSLDQYGELYRWRRAGVKTVGAPPELLE